ncbi:MAG: hypothetical protein ACI808_001673 [Paraglaciecola sp.]|jgi:hypothetical protein
MLNKNKNNSAPTKNFTEQQKRRHFLTTFGKLAVVTPVALAVLISPETSAAPKSCRGWRKHGKHCRRN